MKLLILGNVWHSGFLVHTRVMSGTELTPGDCHENMFRVRGRPAGKMSSAIVKVVVVCLLCLTDINLAFEVEILEVNVKPHGKAIVRWRAAGLEHLEFSILYGLAGEDGSEGTPIEWLTLDNVGCCEVTLNHLRGRSLYTFKVALTLENGYLASPPKKARTQDGVPHDPTNVTVSFLPQDNSTHVAWTQEDAADIQYYNVSLLVDNGQTLWTQTRRPHCRFSRLPAASFTIRVVAANPSGTSHEVLRRHYAPEVGSTSGGKGVGRGNLLWVIVAPVLAVLLLPTLIAAGIYCSRRRRSHSAFRGRKDDNGLSYMPLRLHGAREGQADRLEVRLSQLLAMTAAEEPVNMETSSTQGGKTPSSLRGLHAEVNRIGRRCETSPHKAHFQLVSESSYLGRGPVPACRASRSSSLMSGTPGSSPRSSKRTPIIPLSEEKLLPRVNTDLTRYPSWRESSSPTS